MPPGLPVGLRVLAAVQAVLRLHRALGVPASVPHLSWSAPFVKLGTPLS